MEIEKGDQVCYCGTVDEAVEAATRLYIQLAGADCKIWALQVATALRTIAVEGIVDEKTPRQMIGEACNRLTVFTKSNIDIEVILEDVRKKHEFLYK